MNKCAPDTSCLFLQGPQGFGKSYLLYSVACFLRAHPNENRVVYIRYSLVFFILCLLILLSDCSQLRKELYVWEELIETFLPIFANDLSTNELLTLKDKISRKDINFIKYLIQLCVEKNLKFYIIIDQVKY